VITGGDLQDARQGVDQWQNFSVDFKVRVGAVERFAKFTRNNIGRQMPIVLDARIKSAPSIRSEIGGSGQITGRFSQEEAEDLALNLRAGALPARVITIEERTVGPSLGKDSIDAGVRASIWGSIVICGLMLIYYRRSGINAIVALMLNLLILAACMAKFGAVLTLPGIAGYALTVGMAVDSNVLIFERIREELRAGRTVRAAIDAGFRKAFKAIIDTHVTTIVSAFFLFTYGTGPVKGFAVSLTVGLVANLFTSLVVSRYIYDLEVGDRPVQRLSI
jgi:preprotein translocase subunit SecD